MIKKFLNLLYWLGWYPEIKFDERIKTECDGCGNGFMYPIHKHYCYNSCSVACDEIIDEILK